MEAPQSSVDSVNGVAASAAGTVSIAKLESSSTVGGGTESSTVLVNRKEEGQSKSSADGNSYAPFPFLSSLSGADSPLLSNYGLVRRTPLLFRYRDWNEAHGSMARDIDHAFPSAVEWHLTLRIPSRTAPLHFSAPTVATLWTDLKDHDCAQDIFGPFVYFPLLPSSLR